MKKLSESERTAVTLEMLNEQPLETIAHVALLKVSELGLKSNSQETTITTTAIINKKRYKCKMVVTWQEEAVNAKIYKA